MKEILGLLRLLGFGIMTGCTIMVLIAVIMCGVLDDCEPECSDVSVEKVEEVSK